MASPPVFGLLTTTQNRELSRYGVSSCLRIVYHYPDP